MYGLLQTVGCAPVDLCIVPISVDSKHQKGRKEAPALIRGQMEVPHPAKAAITGFGTNPKLAFLVNALDRPVTQTRRFCLFNLAKVDRLCESDNPDEEDRGFASKLSI